MGKMTAFAVLLAAGCQPMYDGKSQSLPKVRVVPHKTAPVVDPPIAYIDNCPTNFHADPKGVFIDRPRASELVVKGETAIQLSEKAPDPQSATSLVVSGIESYRSALVKDPYDPDATLKLALAYDKVLRRGCALKLLLRISALENHPRFRVAARRVVGRVEDSPEMFKGYRQDAISALNGSAPAAKP